jgi:capsular polysaccharide export protein
MFDRLTRWLRAGGASVHRIVFQGGDLLDTKALIPIRFQERFPEWEQFLDDLLDQHDIDCIVLFGQSRPYHSVAKSAALTRGLKLIVLEEGYFRPGFITMELGGVNGYSNTLQRYLWDPALQNQSPALLPSGSVVPDITRWHFQKMAWHASSHYLAMSLARMDFPGYRHHRGTELPSYAGYWLRSWQRKVRRRSQDLHFQEDLFRSQQPYFLIPLQHDGDAQIVHHSPFEQNTDFIIKVMRSFAEYASTQAWLVFRQHPHSRGGRGHHRFILSLANELGISDRVHHLIEGDTPRLAQHATGVVVINSTVGLQAIERGAPVKALGAALYNLPGVTDQGDLDAFWRSAKAPERQRVELFLDQIKNLTQVPISAYALEDEPILWGASP